MPQKGHRNQIDYILCSQRWRSSIQSAKTRPGADCGSDHEFLIAKFRLKLKKVGKTTRPFRIDLNQIPYYYTVEVRNRFKGLPRLHSQAVAWQPRLSAERRESGSQCPCHGEGAPQPECSSVVREAFAVCTPPAPEPSAERPGS